MLVASNVLSGSVVLPNVESEELGGNSKLLSGEIVGMTETGIDAAVVPKVELGEFVELATTSVVRLVDDDMPGLETDGVSEISPIELTRAGELVAAAEAEDVICPLELAGGITELVDAEVGGTVFTGAVSSAGRSAAATPAAGSVPVTLLRSSQLPAGSLGS